LLTCVTDVLFWCEESVRRADVVATPAPSDAVDVVFDRRGEVIVDDLTKKEGKQ
jgi:hypothetical protein